MIYFDSAATSLMKPESVCYAMTEAIRRCASPGRGAYPAAMRAADICFQCREHLAEMFHVPQPENVVFTFNATHALNLAIHSLVEENSHVLISGYEHNSVTRPLAAIGAKVTAVDTPLFDNEAFLNRFRALLPQNDVVVCTHVSNVFGYILPIEKVASLCRAYEKPLIIDASQSAGILPLNFASLGAMFAAMPGHKGLLGPQGTGVLLCKKEANPLLYGGSGSDSRRQNMPDTLPDRLEAGTHNVTGIAGLNAGIEFLHRYGLHQVRKRERELLEFFAWRMQHETDAEVFFSEDPAMQCGVISLRPEKESCEAVGDRLAAGGVSVRTGLHCAPLAHSTAGTLETGTVRFSFSPFNQMEEVESAVDIYKKIRKK